MKSISSKYIIFSNSCKNLKTKYLLSSEKPTKNQTGTYFKAKCLIKRKQPQLNFKSLEKLIHLNFVNIYSNDKNFYNIKVINDIISNESTHVVAEFKDYLIKGDDSEFLQNYYQSFKSLKYLPKIFDYYQSCSVIFPNYVVLPESKYIYKNIQKKQIVIDAQQEQEEKKEQIKKGLIKIEEDDILFTSNALHSILNQTDTSNIRNIFGIIKGEDNNETPGGILNLIEKEEEKAVLTKNTGLIKKSKKDKYLKNNNNNLNKNNKKEMPSNKRKISNKYISKNNKFISKSKSKSKSKNKSKCKNKNKVNISEGNKKYIRNISTNTHKNNMNMNLLNDFNINFFKYNNSNNINDILNYNLKKKHNSLISNNNSTNSNIINNHNNKKYNPFNHLKINRKNIYNPIQTKKLIINMLLNKSKPNQSNKYNRNSVKIKKNQNKFNNRKHNFSFSLSPSFATKKVNKMKKKNSNNVINGYINSSDSSSNLNIVKKKSKSKEKKEKSNVYKNDSLFKTIPIKINNNFDLLMPSNSSDVEIMKDTKNNYCTIVPQVLNMLSLNIYKINSTNKTQIYPKGEKNQTISKKNTSQKKLKNGQKIHIKRTFSHKKDRNIIKSNIKKSKKVYSINKKIIDTNSNENNIILKNVALTSRQFSSSPNKMDEENFLNNILCSPSSGNFGYMEIKNNIIIKNKNAVIPIRKSIKKRNNIINNIPLTSRCLLNTSNTRNIKKGNMIDKNYFNLRGGFLGNSNSIITKVSGGVGEIINNNTDTNTICSVKSIGHIFKTRKKSNAYNKPSLNFYVSNNK